MEYNRNIELIAALEVTLEKAKAGKIEAISIATVIEPEDFDEAMEQEAISFLAYSDNEKLIMIEHNLLETRQLINELFAEHDNLGSLL